MKLTSKLTTVVCACSTTLFVNSALANDLCKATVHSVGHLSKIFNSENDDREVKLSVQERKAIERELCVTSIGLYRYQVTLGRRVFWVLKSEFAEGEGTFSPPDFRPAEPTAGSNASYHVPSSPGDTPAAVGLPVPAVNAPGGSDVDLDASVASQPSAPHPTKSKKAKAHRNHVPPN